MGETRKADDFISGFENLSQDEQKEIIKKLMPKFCEIVMKDKTVIQEMMPECLEMMKGADFPIKETMSNMMGKKF